MSKFCILLACIILLVIPSPSHASKTHKVKQNESLYTIAKRYHIKVGELKSANNIVNNRIKIGTMLVIPSGTATDADSHGRSGKYGAGVYKVKNGDNLLGVARKTGISVKELKRLNGIAKNKRLKPGQFLVLRDRDSDENGAAQVKQLNLRNNDLFNAKDYEQSLTELTEDDTPGQEVDLSKNLELKTDNEKILKTKAYGFLGTHYRFGGNGVRGIDCSGFVQQVFRKMEISLPRTAREQFTVGSEVAPGDLQKGDLVFFKTYARYPSHVGIYLGDSKMIHASSRDHRVVISTMDTPYYRSRFIGAKRIARINPDVFKFDDLLSGVQEEKADDASTNDSLEIGLNP